MVDVDEVMVAELLGKAAQTEDIVDDYEMDLFEKGYLDSIGIMDLIELIEEEYQIELLPEEIVPENFTNVSSICRMIKKYLS